MRREIEMELLYRTFIALWVVTSLGVLATSLYSYDGQPNSDIGVFLAWAMVFLSFPCGLVFAALFAIASIAIESLFGTVIQTSYASISVIWVGFFISGYLQWFWLVPWLASKTARRVARGVRPDGATHSRD